MDRFAPLVGAVVVIGVAALAVRELRDDRAPGPSASGRADLELVSRWRRDLATMREHEAGHVRLARRAVVRPR